MKKVIFLILIAACFMIPFKGSATVEEEIAARTKQIEELQRQIAGPRASLAVGRRTAPRPGHPVKLEQPLQHYPDPRAGDPAEPRRARY